MLKEKRYAVLQGLDWVQQAILVGASLFIAVCMFSEVVLRYAFHRPIIGIEEIVLIGAFWLYFIGSSYGAYKRTQIRAEVVEMLMKTPSAVAITRVAASAIAFGGSLYLSKWALDFFIYGLTEGQFTPTLFIPAVFSQSAVFFGLVLMTLYFLIELIDRVRAVRNPNTGQMEDR